MPRNTISTTHNKSERIVKLNLLSRTGRTRRRTLFLLTTAALAIFPSSALALEKITFSWYANPPQDYVLGYRLYYGTSSRYTSEGLPKSNFSYDYYIDFTLSERCLGDGTDTHCEQLDPSALLCENLAGKTPSCTIYNLPGQDYFFAMTAYNVDAESGYTRELTPASSGRWTVLQYVNTLPRKGRK